MPWRPAGELRCEIIGIGTDGKRTIMGVSVALSEAEVHWRDFFPSLVTRGLCGTAFIASDAHPGMAVARQSVFPAVPWQRCKFHLQQNTQARGHASGDACRSR